VKKGFLYCLAALAGLSLMASNGCRKNPHDNTREPDPWTDKPVENHHFDGGESDPYGNNTDKGGSGGGEEKPSSSSSGE
jgi:hypothetical protein